MNARQFFVRTALTAVALFASVAPVRAQESSLAPLPKAAASIPADSVSAAPAAVPTRAAASVGYRTTTEVSRTLPAAPARGGFSHGETLMIVGAAAILTGIVVGNDAGHAISVAGAVIGLVGLYQYLQ